MTDVYKGLPAKVRIGCHLFDVVVGTYENHEEEGTYGHMNSFQKRISLRPGMCATQAANTFIHEVIHAIHWTYGLFKGDEEPQPTEEEYTMLAANGLCAFVQDNPAAIKWWQRNLALEV